MQPHADKPEDFQEVQLKEFREANTVLQQDIYSMNSNSNYSLHPLSTYIDETGQKVFIDQPAVYYQVPQKYSQAGGSKQDGIVIGIEPTDNISHITQDDIKIIKFAIFAKYCALGNIIVDALLALALPYLIVILLFNMIGYCGARNLNKCLCSGYCVYLGMIVVARIFLMIYFPIVYVVVVFSLLVIFQIFLFGVFFILAKMLFDVDSEKLQKIFEYFRQGIMEKGSFWAIF